MRNLVVSLLILIATAAVALETPEDRIRKEAIRAKLETLFANERRMEKTRPYRRESPLRSDNVTDREVKEIQIAAGTVAPGALVNIGGVVRGCPCEDGPWCSDQVWIVAVQPGKTIGFLLSKMDGHWAVGPVQRWWWDYENLQQRRGDYPSLTKWYEAEDQMKLNYPACDAQLAVPGEASAKRPPP